MPRLRRTALVFLLAAIPTFLTAQSFDSSATSQLNGAYFIRELLLSDFDNNGNFVRARSLTGTLAFDGKGAYSFNGQLADSTTSLSQAQPYSVDGQYSVASNGFAHLTPLIDQAIATEDRTIYGTVSQSVFVGSSTEGSAHDLVIAIPAGSGGSNFSLRGTYVIGALGFLQAQASMARDAYFSLTSDGVGNFSSFSINGSAANLASASMTQTLSGATYSMGAGGGGTAIFPPATTDGDPANQLFSGNKVMYVSEDGGAILGGDPNGFDIFFGIRPMSSAASSGTYQGTYFLAGLEDDASNLAVGQSNIDSFYGSANAFGDGHAINHLRLNSVLNGTYDYTYDLSYSVDSGGTVSQGAFYYQFGPNGQSVIVVGQGNEYHLSIGLHAPAYSGGAVFLNPIGIVNAASLAPITNPVAPGELVTLYGTGLAPSVTQAHTLPFPTSGLGGVEVLVNGRRAALYYGSPTQVSAIVPSATVEAYATFQVINNGTASNKVTLYTSRTAPGVFTLNQAGFGSGAILHAGYSLVTPQNPAAIGETVLVFLTGLGSTSPPVSDGAAGPTKPLSVVTDPKLQVFIDGQPASIAFGGLAPGLAGLYQINVQVPQNIHSGNVYLDISTSVSYHSQSTISIQ